MATPVDVVALNVGGTLFNTTLATLTKSGPKSRLAAMFSPFDLSKRPPMVSGAFFVDRDPAPFAVILNFLRTGTFHADQSVGFQRVMEEAAFFGVSGMLEQKGRILMLIDYGGEPPKQRGWIFRTELDQGRGVTIPSSQLSTIYNSIGIAVTVTPDGKDGSNSHFALNRDTLDFHENKCVLFAQTNGETAPKPTVEALMSAGADVRREWDCVWSMAADLPRDSGSWGNSCAIS